MKFLLNLLVLGLIAFAFLNFVDSGSSPREEKVFSVDDFTSIELSGPFKVYLKQGDECALRIVSEEKIFHDLEVDVHNGQLEIELEDNVWKSKNKIKLYIEFKELSKLEILGAVDLRNDDIIKTRNLKLEFEGAGNVDMEIEAEKIISEISGVGSFQLMGSTDYHKVTFDGVGSYNTRDLISKNTMVNSNGVGTVRVYAEDKCIIDSNGIGSVFYYGDPEDISVNASGIGKVKGEYQD